MLQPSGSQAAYAYSGWLSLRYHLLAWNPWELTSRAASSTDTPKLLTSVPSAPKLWASPLRATLNCYSRLTTRQLPENRWCTKETATKGLCQSLLPRNFQYMNIQKPKVLVNSRDCLWHWIFLCMIPKWFMNTRFFWHLVVVTELKLVSNRVKMTL